MTMFVGRAEITLRIFACRSLKEKRFVIKSLKDRIAGKFPVSIAEVDNLDLWQKATLGLAMVSSNQPLIEKTLNAIRAFIENDGRAEIIDFFQEID